MTGAVKNGVRNLSHHRFVESSDRQLLAIAYRLITNFKLRPWLSIMALVQPLIAISLERKLNTPARTVGAGMA